MAPIPSRRAAGVALCVLLLLIAGGAPGTSAPRAAGTPPPSTSEADRREYVRAVHRSLLGREAGPAEVEAGLQVLRSGVRPIQLLARLLDSAEFRARVEDGAFVVALYRQVRGRAPLLHETMIARHHLEEGVPRGEMLGALLHAGGPDRPPAAALERLYDGFVLDLGPRRLSDHRREARGLSPATMEASRRRLLEEAAGLGGAAAGPPDPWADVDMESGGPDPELHDYYGFLHAHSRVSLDAALLGSRGPFEAFRYARDVAGLDFMGLSDHAEFLSAWPWKDEWRLLQAAADAHNRDGAFVALRGFEYSNPIYGHINVFGTEGFTSTWTSLTLPQFYEWLADQPLAASTFNHPGAYDGLGLEFQHFDFFPDVRRQLVGIELLTHGHDYTTYDVGYAPGDGFGHIDEANRAGWAVASVSAQDNHRGGWGTIDDYRTGVLATALTRDALLEALRRRRFFSTQDKNLSMSFRADGREMGSTLPPGAKRFTVRLDDADGEGFARIDLYAAGDLIESRAASGRGTWDFEVGPSSTPTYYYVLVTQEDGDRAMSAPLWVQGARSR